MAERIPLGVSTYKPLSFESLDRLIYLDRQRRFVFKDENTHSRSARAMDERNRPLPEIELIMNFFTDLRRNASQKHKEPYAQTDELNQLINSLSDISPLYAVLRNKYNGKFGAGKVSFFALTDMGVRPILMARDGRSIGLQPENALYADPILIQKVGPANLYAGHRR